MNCLFRDLNMAQNLADKGMCKILFFGGFVFGEVASMAPSIVATSKLQLIEIDETLHSY